MADDNDTRQSREDFQEARRALVDKVVAEHPGLSHQHFDGVKIADFDAHAQGLVTQMADQARTAGAQYLGITVEEFDALKEGKGSSSDGAGESTPQSRTAALPTGKTGGAKPPPASAPVTESLTGVDLIEAAANEFLASSDFLKRG
jgi:hypothetical protein